MSKTYAFTELKQSAQEWALEQVNHKHPVQSRKSTLDVLVALYEYNKAGDIVDFTGEGQDPEYYDEML
jgi:hypothetical protein